ncbi:MAG: sigma 54-interacting transcriptional regulator [Candidatus Hydrogenedentes bacterium]|nr:sigma 54-interacting transcriptional regulator [Candidatus Hydrogenedentota bacterium]
MSVSKDPLDNAVTSAAGPFSLRLLNGPFGGKSWPFLEELMVIGRGVGCHIRLEDPYISRVQCEVRMAEGKLRLRNLSERNPTRVNGNTQEEAWLKPGDILEFGNIQLILDRGGVAGKPFQDYLDDHAPTTQCFSKSLHLQEFSAQAYVAAERTGELHALFNLQRALGRASSLDALMEVLKAHLRERLHARRVWIAWRMWAEDELALYPPASPEETREAPFTPMRKACKECIGVEAPAAKGGRGAQTLAAPLLHGGRPFGALAICRDSLDKTFTSDEMQYLLTVAESSAPLIRAAERLEQMGRDAALRTPQAPLQHMIGASASSRQLQVELRRVAVTRANVLLLGETGVGKELAARMLHDFSARAAGPYVVINCAAIPAELFESEVFGHERGAFTGAERRRSGLFEQAHGGTLFLDEVGDLSLANQARLLRAVETGTFRPVGAERDLKVDVRLVSATNQDLTAKHPGGFRMDLYHRLAGMVICIQPLRERREDIPELAQYFLDLCAPHALTHPKRLAPEAIEKLSAYSWPGNVRELRNVVERACYTVRGEHISASDIQVETKPIITGAPAGLSLQDLERHHLIESLRRHHGNALAAAAELKVSRSTLYYKLARHHVKGQEYR